MTITRRNGSRARMLLRLLTRASLVQPARIVPALLAVIVASAVATAMLTLYIDSEAKLRSEFRGYGANVVVSANGGHSLPADVLSRVESQLPSGSVAAQFAYAVARTGNGQPIVVAGADFARVKKLDSWWSVTKWPETQNSALVGARAKAALSADGNPFTLDYNGRKLSLTPAGILSTGADEETRVYLPMRDFEAWTGVQPSVIEILIPGNPAEVNSTMNHIAAALPGVEVRPVRQMVEAQARVLGKTKASILASSTVIILTAALCVIATLIAWVLDRRRDVAVMKALGASESLISGFFALQAAGLGFIGALVGFLIGIGVAAWIGQANFQSAITPRPLILPGVLLGSSVLALIASVIPISLLRRVQPAAILRGE